ncbi:SIR2 family protein [Klebsiella michiganensis]|uniref:SIR2 family protein n=1 Tax=Klebsiella TaxID=570 RepID=UPI0015A9B33A|nr:SIR2 family protein [Klebsiella grimontii]ELT9750903.1 SIR2 family protein [Klebsiella michiganensis]QLO78869.1 SIR2 family protein [Klebsiella grimontii]
MISQDTINELLRKVSSRRAVLFLGSGFSCDAVDFNKDSLPTASILATNIAKINNMNSFDDLKYTSDRVISDGYGEELVKLLRRTFTVKDVQEHHQIISALPWQRVYTTNYDLCFEQAAKNVSIDYATIDISNDSLVELKRDNLCIHINGSLKNLSIDTLNTSFKLSESSYLSSDSIESSQWFYPMQRDFEEASAIIFIGYSLYDIEVKKILLDETTVKDKVYFITYDLPDERTLYTFEKFGTVLPIKTSGFADLFKGYIPDDVEFELRVLNQYDYRPSKSNITDTDVDRFLLTGDIDNSIVDYFQSKSNERSAPILIFRKELNQAFELVKNNANILITSELGNGKTIFLKILCSVLSQNSHDVYYINSLNNNTYHDIEFLSKSTRQSILIFDSYEQYIDLLNFIDGLKSSKITLILASRTSSHEYFFSKFKFHNLNFTNIEIDELDHDEVVSLIQIIDNIGLWGDNASLMEDHKIRLIDRKYKNQISLILLGIINSPVIISKIKSNTFSLLENKDYKKTIFTICLLSFLDLPLTKSLISEIAQNRAIYDLKLIKDKSFTEFFGIKKNQASTKSSLFSLSFITNIFESNYIVDELLNIVELLGNTKHDVHERRELQKAILRFSIVERLLPPLGIKTNLIRYYENLKRALPIIKEDPHYWLQYGMAMLTYNDYVRTERFFGLSYNLANNRLSYHTQHIDVQSSRLNLMKASDRTLDLQTIDRFKLFEEAHAKLCKVDNDIHKFRQLHLYRDVFDVIYSDLSPKNKTTFEYAFKRVLDDIDKLEREEPRSAKNKTIRNIKALASEYITKIVNLRQK